VRLGSKCHNLFGAVSNLAGGPLDLDLKGPRATANPEERERILTTVFGGDLDYFRAQSPWVLAEQNAAAVPLICRTKKLASVRGNRIIRADSVRSLPVLSPQRQTLK
jgi:hypothetical protein